MRRNGDEARPLSRRDEMMVARYEMPGNTSSKDPSRRVRYDRVGRGVLLSCTMSNSRRHGSYRSLRDGSYPRPYQAFHAWLPSFGPSGTVRVRPHGDTTVCLQYSNAPTLHRSARQNSRTRTTSTRTRTRRRMPNGKARTPNACIP